MAQIITSKGGGGGGGGASYTAGTGIDITSNVISVDEAVVQTVGNMVTNLTGADDDHYPTALAVANAISGGGSGDVIGPASSTDGDIVLFDGATGKIIKDSGVGLSSKLDASALSDNNYGGAWNGDTTHTPTKNALYTKIHTMDVEIGNKAADNTVVKLSGNQTINGTKTFGTSPVVPSKTAAATNTGTAIATEAQVKLVADDVATINGMISSNASSSNKLMDKNYIDDSINSVTAYYITKNAQGDQWATYAELAAATTFYSGGVARTPTRNDYTIVLADENHDNATTRYIYNSGWEYQYTVNETALTQAQLDALNSGITSGKVSTYDGYATTISGKQDALSLPATPTQGNLVVWGANNKTLVDGGAIPSTADCVKTSGDQTIAGTKTFSTSPVVPSKTTDATNTGTAIATEAQVYKKQDKLTTQTAYTSKGTSTKVPTITTNTLGQVTGITETSISFPVTSVNGSTGAVTVSEFTPGGTATTGYVVTKTAGGYEWQAPSGGYSTITVTLTSAGWSSNSQTVSATGVTASNTVIVSPSPDDIADYADCGVYCSAQGSGTLTFGCDTAPSGDIVVNVLIMS